MRKPKKTPYLDAFRGKKKPSKKARVGKAAASGAALAVVGAAVKKTLGKSDQ